MFYGSRHNLIMPGDATHMGDGWETKRRRGPGHDWTIVRLGAAGTIRRVEVDTRHFKGNAPGACSLDGGPDSRTASRSTARRGASCCRARRCSRTPGTRSRTSCARLGDVTHVRLNIFPDGGIARLRLFGRPR